MSVNNETPKYAKKIITNEYKIALGTFFLGFSTSSPVVAIQSNPTKPKKHVAAPLSVPENPNGKNPPPPTACLYSGGTSAGSIFQ